MDILWAPALILALPVGILIGMSAGHAICDRCGWPR